MQGFDSLADKAALDPPGYCREVRHRFYAGQAATHGKGQRNPSLIVAEQTGQPHAVSNIL